MTDKKQNPELHDLDARQEQAEDVKGGVQESQKMQEMNMSLKAPVPGAPTARQ